MFRLFSSSICPFSQMWSMAQTRLIITWALFICPLNMPFSLAACLDDIYSDIVLWRGPLSNHLINSFMCMGVPMQAGNMNTIRTDINTCIHVCMQDILIWKFVG